MNPNDERIDRVLDALRDAEPPNGMEQRLQAALQAAEKNSAQPVSWLRQPAFAISAFAVLAAGVVIAILSLGVRPMRHQHEIAASGSMPAHSPIAGSVASRQSTMTPVDRTFHMPVVARQHVLKTVAQSAPEAHAQEQNIPAPPMPLTRQEVLLLRLAHRNNPSRLGVLVADARESSFQKGKEEVRDFFKPALRPDQVELNSNLSGENQ